ncbi:MAG: hypothetical protein KAU31_09040 [Spirochaetaceae bacterium]|nr:hypothetical protein [Spirochaetaceae bacterium]
MSEILQYDIAGREFSDLYASVRSGHYDAFPQEDLLWAVLGNESGLTDAQREALIEQLLVRESRLSGTGERAGSVVTIVLNRFDLLSEPSLRARVLARAGELNLIGTEAAVLHSARHLSSMLQRDGNRSTVQGYEVEAMALAAVAPRYPSTVLAELLRIIAGQSGDKRVVLAIRNAARLILLSPEDGN